MARLSTYAIDGTPVSSDKLIGTDDSGAATKNYPLGTVAAWLKESGATAILGQNNFIFQTEVDPQVGRLPGTFSLPVVGGDGTPFSDITTLKFSITSSAGQYVVDYIASTVGSKVILGQLDDLNAFGVYALESFTQDPETPTFYNAVLSLASGNGSLIGAKSYGFATYSSSATSGGTWGGITGTITNQTDLVDYIDAEIAAIPTPATPTLQSVTDAGAITTNDITTGSVTSNGNFLITGNDSTVQLRGSSVDFNIQTTAADNVARIATTTGGSARLDLYNHISGFNGALEFRATSWENDALVISGGTPNATKFLVSRDPNAATLQVTGESYFTGNVGIGTTAPSYMLDVSGTVRLKSNASELILDNSTYSEMRYGTLNYFRADGSQATINGPIIRLRVGGDEKMRVHSDGNVGIGTTSPAEKLEVAGNIKSTKLLLNTTNTGYTFYSNGESRINNITFQSVGNDDYLQKSANNGRFWIRNTSSGQSILLGATDSSGGLNDYLLIDGNNQELRVRTASSDRFIINSIGNVGIGTTAPAAKLHVSGELRLNAGQSLMLDVANGIYAVAAQNQFRLYSGGNPAISITTAGRVGIGTTNPFSQLEVKKDSYTEARVRGNSDIYKHLSLAHGGNFAYVTGSRSLLVLQSGDATYQYPMHLNTGGSVRMIIDETGNVGIGTTAPTEKLQVLNSVMIGERGFASFSDGRLRVASTTDYGEIGFSSKYDNFPAGIRSYAVDALYERDLRFYTKDTISAADGNLRMIITGGGNVGIGTTTPDVKLEVEGTIKASTHGDGLVFSSPTTVKYKLGVYGANDLLFKDPNNNVLMVLASGGNVGIGNTAPDEKLRVEGNIKSAGDFIGSAVKLGFAGTANITTYDTNEDLLINPNGSGNILMQTSSGNVGIGTTSPAAKLDVNGSIYPTTNNGGTLGLLQYKEWSYVATTRITGNNNRMELVLSNNTVILKDHNSIGDGIQIKSRGNVLAQFGDANGSVNVGIGTTAPNSKVHISGTAMQQLRMETAGGPSSAGDTTGRIGDMAYDDDFFYIKTANGWGRVQLDFGF